MKTTDTPGEALLVLSTFPDQPKAIEVANAIVTERLAACANLIPAVRSLYRWEGELCDDAEVLVLLKTSADRFDDLRARIVELHPYDCPEVIALPVCAGHLPYLEWVNESTRKDQ